MVMTELDGSVGDNVLLLLSYFAHESVDLPLYLVPILNRSGDFVPPTRDTLRDKRYDYFLRPLYLNGFVSTDLRPLSLRGIMDMFLAPRGPTVVNAKGYVAASEEDQDENIRRFAVVRSRLYCFSSTNMVKVLGKGLIPIGQLKIGDRVLTSGANHTSSYDTVYTFGHFDPNAVAEFVRIEMEGEEEGTEVIELTQDHLISVGGKFVPANAVLVGDQLQSIDGTPTTVTRIRRVERVGAYAPFTESGIVGVSGIVASSYCNIQGSTTSSDAFMFGGITARTFVSYQFMAHLSQTPHRLAWRLGWVDAASGQNNESGVPWWISYQLMIAEWWLVSLTPVVQLVVLVPAVIALALLRVVEWFLMKNCTFWGAMVIVVVVTATRFV
uniref:Hedgehog protein Hint domain-containing protein n=1 Tax=Cyclophora tenuis TaxID=216820 RepID=A0A7S1GPT7_CYCTE